MKTEPTPTDTTAPEPVWGSEWGSFTFGSAVSGGGGKLASTVSGGGDEVASARDLSPLSEAAPPADEGAK